jgi:molecular chaperone DnaK
MGHFGIDFGTTNCATIELFNNQVLKYSEDAGKPFPSLVAVDRLTGEVVARGLEVKENRNTLLKTCEIISSPKSFLGTDHIWPIANRDWTPKDIAREIFKGLKDLVSQRQTDMDEAVVAIPVGFAPDKRRALREAAEEAGIKIKSFISEPTAAIFKNYDQVRRWRKCVVLDWGGGTLDISVVEMNGESVKEIDAVGIPLGGDNLDRKIAEWVYNGHIKKNGGAKSFHELDSKSMDDLLVRCEEAKCSLGEDQEYSLFIPNFTEGEHLRTEITRRQLFDLLKDDYRTVLYELHKVVSAKARMSFGEIGCILMVGGSSKLVGLQEIIQKNTKGCLVIPPSSSADWDVAHGASFLSSTPGNYIITDNIGVELSDGSFFPLVKSGEAPSMCNGTLNFGVVEDVEMACFKFIKSESQRPDSAMSKSARKIGTLLAPCNGFVNESIRLSYSIDDNLFLNITAKSNFKNEEKYRHWEYGELLFSYELPPRGEYFDNE